MVAPPIGVVVHVLPPVYTRVWIYGAPYYYANDVYYVPSPQGYRVTQPPPGEVITEQPASNDAGNDTISEQPANDTVSRGPADQLFIYPRQGQDQQQQEKDRNECHDWGVGQTGYDPHTAVNNDKRADFQRATSACLDGRGYTVK